MTYMNFPDFEKNSSQNQWNRFCELLFYDHQIGLWLDVSRMKINIQDFVELKPQFEKAFQAMDSLEKGEIEEKEQDSSLSSYAKKINKQDREINCKEEPAIKIDRKIRALTQENPCFINYKDKRLILLEAIPADTEIEPGRLLILNNYLLLGCAKNSSLNILKIQLPGKKPITAKEFISGYGDLIEG